MNRIEILSPAGGEEQLIAAVRSGADAVYLGTHAFNARQHAENFGSDLPRIVSYCHARNVKVNVTVNTLIRDREMDELARVCDLVGMSGADRAIVQDLSVYRYFREAWPAVGLSASTQMAVHNVDGARMLEDMGYDCIVLARELTLEEMRRITSAVKCECEAFIHGAHCMSLSGACYLSAMLGGRSGNRGLCAQPCRLDFRCGRRDYALSLKDMSLISHMHEMSEAGVTSFKIEGRMKRPEYVAAVTDACVRAREGLAYDEEKLANVFSRSGFTDGYLTGRRNARMFGRRTESDADKTQEVLSSLRELYRTERPSVPYDAHLTLKESEGALVTVTDGTNTVTLTGDVPALPRTRGTNAEDAARAFGKTGGTPFFLRGIELINNGGLVLPASSMNALRREALQELLAKRETPVSHVKCDFAFTAQFPHSPVSPPRTVGCFRDPAQAEETEGLDRIVLPSERITEKETERYGEKLICSLPPVCFPENEEAIKKNARRVRELGVRYALCDNLYAIKTAKECGLVPVGGFSLNIMNSISLKEYEKLGLAATCVSFELPIAEAKRLAGTLPRGETVYGYMPLMRMRSCPARNENGCGSCGGNPHLTDRKGIDFPILCSSHMYSTLLNSVPTDLCGRDIRGFDFVLFYFTRETAAECARAVKRYLAGEKSTDPHTTGLMYKDLQ